MEVDDAVISSPAEDEVSPSHDGENGSRATRHFSRRNAVGKSSMGKAEEDPPGPPTMPTEVEEPPIDEEGAANDSALSATPLKLRLSSTEEEGDESREAFLSQLSSLRRNILQSPDNESQELQQNAMVSLKRKRYEVRRSGSEEFLLGFDEQSGEAELMKENIADATSEASIDKSEINSEIKIQTASPRAAKKMKQSPDSSSFPMKSSPRAQVSPGGSPRGATQSENKQPEQLKPHIVGDNEDANGGLLDTNRNTSPSSRAVQAAGGSPTKKPLSPQDDFYKKPFEFGWKRELVWRANMESSKDKADVYFITPSGKKLRTRNDIIPLLGGELSIDHFCFAREPLGMGSEYETVRSAKPSTRVSVTAATLAAAPASTNIGKRVSKPKGPKGASPPPQGWTPTRALKVNNAALLSSASSSRYSSNSANPGTPPSSRNAHGGSSASSKSSKTKKVIASASCSSSPSRVVRRASHEPCSVKCQRAPGHVPQLKCVKCLCLFHHECVGLSRLNCEYRVATGDAAAGGQRDYVCEACLPLVETAVTNVAARSPAAVAAQRPPRSENKFPQTIAVVKGKKYVMVAKPIATPAEHVNDIENDLKQINESIRNSRKPSTVSLDAAFQAHNTPATVDQSNKLFATNFFANVSFAYDALLCILKYLKIHERPRAASVCRLWHLAAKDTSLWHTVRMKNSKVSNWAGFAAALRRGETKHLDLRKMLVPGTRSDEMWQDFSQHIGTVCSLEVIDLCRCSAHVVEHLFQSNKQLRVLNALAVNDDAINLEDIGLLAGLEELRLRTCEPGVLTGDLLPLQSLTKLAHLSLTAMRGLGSKHVEVLGELSSLRSLELGECGDFDATFADAVLPKLINLQRLRLENGSETNCCTLQILDAVARLEQLTQLELVNFDIKCGFDEKLNLCTNIRKLLIIPTYISQSATTNHIVLSAVQQVAPTLKVFTWGVTVELLRVTALYVDQCEESTKKEKHHFDECIPVLKPVPGAPAAEEDDVEQEQDAAATQADGEVALNEVPQIEILPLDKVETILGENLPHTKFTIVKVPYHVTCKQQLVE